MSRTKYTRIANLAPQNTNWETSPENDPLTYCINNTLEQGFSHGSTVSNSYGQNSKPCQAYLSEYCSNNWNGVCELAAANLSKASPNYIGTFNTQSRSLSQGEILIVNTADRKYRVLNVGSECAITTEIFDPNVVGSPNISYYSGSCVPVYSVNPMIIDTDPVMNKILDKPEIAGQLLINIFNTMKRLGTLNQLQGTRLGDFYGIN